MRRRRGSRSAGGDGGAALVEAAIATPVVVAALAALVVTSVLWRDQLAASDAAAAGARVAGLHPVVAGPAAQGVPADLGPGTSLVLGVVAAALGGVSADVVERVVVFGAAPATGVAADDPVALVPPGCRFGDGPAPAEPCVVLRRDAVAVPASVPACGPGACVWRDAPGVAVVGVFVRVRRPDLLGGLVPSPAVEAVALAPLEGGPRV